MPLLPPPSTERVRAEPTDANGKDWWKRGVIYQVYPRSFQDQNGDGIGDLSGITARLDYLQDLGISAVWVAPFFRSPMKDFGYDVEDHRAVDPIFGSLDDFDELVTEAHRRGIRIMIDLVLSHAADSHPWFQSARSQRGAEWEDCFVWADPAADGSPPNNWLSIFGGSAWTFEPNRGQFYLHNFLDSQPDLNFHDPRVQAEALSIARWWLDRGVDGFRLDTVNFYFQDRQLRDNPRAARPDTQVVSADNPYSLQDHLYDKNRPQVCGFLNDLGELLAEYPGAVALGEVGATEERALELMVQYQQPGRLQLCYTFDWLSVPFTARAFRTIIERDAQEAPTVWRCVAFSNHDVQRTATRLNQAGAPTEAIAPLAMALLLSLRGTPCIYQGEELGLTEADIAFEDLVDPYGKAFWPTFKGRDGCRTPMPWTHNEPHAGFTAGPNDPWLPIPENHRERAVDRQSVSAHSILQKTRALIALHRNHPAFGQEEIAILPSPDELLIFERGRGEAAVLCAFNLSDKPADYAPLGHWANAVFLEQGGSIVRTESHQYWRMGRWSWLMASSH